MQHYKIKENGSVVVLDGEYPFQGGGEWFLLMSDLHIDSTKHRLDLLNKLLKQAQDKGAGVLMFGDIFDAMQSRNDKRRSVSALKEQFNNREDYVDAIVEDVAKILRPYADNIMFIGYGNHETNLIKHLNTDILKRLVEELRKQNEQIVLGGYGGYIRLRYRKYLNGNAVGSSKNFTIAYHHEGGAGNAPVTEGIINAKRRMQWCVDFDIMLSGHNHKSWIMHQTQERISEKNRLKRKLVTLLKIPSLKDKEEMGYSWDITNDFPPPVNGAYWLHLRRGQREYQSMEYDVFLAT
jgi:hypothetical protein